MPSTHGRGPPRGLPWQVGVRALALLTGVTLLVVVEVQGAALYAAWALIVAALASEGAATLLYQRRSRR